MSTRKSWWCGMWRQRWRWRASAPGEHEDREQVADDAEQEDGREREFGDGAAGARERAVRLALLCQLLPLIVGQVSIEAVQPEASQKLEEFWIVVLIHR